MTVSLNNLAAPWEVWLAHVRFADKPKAAKVRPVVIIDSDADPKVAAKVTSSNPGNQFACCELVDWKREGLVKASRVQLSPLLRLSDSDLLNGKPIGRLTERDKIALDTALKPRH